MTKLTPIAIFLLIILGAYIGRWLYMKPKFDEGEKAPDFEIDTYNGGKVKLSDLKGKYVLLDFWGSWCGPCIKEMPQLMSLYKKYNGRTFKQAEDFEIIGIAIERKRERWENTIKELKLNWKYHYSDFNYFDSPIVKHYGVREIPSKYLLDKTGQIIAVNPTVPELDRLLSEDLENFK